MEPKRNWLFILTIEQYGTYDIQCNPKKLGI